MLEQLHDVGPSEDLEPVFASRLNVLLGDNSLGNTFLLDVAWWVLTRTWAERPAGPGKAELRARVGPEGPSRELIEDWNKRFPPPTARAPRAHRAAAVRDDDREIEETDEP